MIGAAEACMARMGDTASPETWRAVMDLAAQMNALRIGDRITTTHIEQLKRATEAHAKHRRDVWIGQNRLAAILCVMSDDPRMGIGPCERYALPVWRDDDLIGGI